MNNEHSSWNSAKKIHLRKIDYEKTGTFTAQMCCGHTALNCAQRLALFLEDFYTEMDKIIKLAHI